MSRIGKAYESRIRALLLRLRARQMERGVSLLLSRARQTSRPAAGFAEAYERLRRQVAGFERRRGLSQPRRVTTSSIFLCDAGLGGLARWLRAAGYDALWFPGIDDAELLLRARQTGGIVLTTDSLMMERGVLRDGVIPSLWLPPCGSAVDQLGTVLREFGLAIREPRCMRCGGELMRVESESVRAEVPPRTWKWIETYFRCARCGKVFWRGTHWQRIQTALVSLTQPQTGG